MSSPAFARALASTRNTVAKPTLSLVLAGARQASIKAPFTTTGLARRYGRTRSTGRPSLLPSAEPNATLRAYHISAARPGLVARQDSERGQQRSPREEELKAAANATQAPDLQKQSNFSRYVAEEVERESKEQAARLRTEEQEELDKVVGATGERVLAAYRALNRDMKSSLGQALLRAKEIEASIANSKVDQELVANVAGRMALGNILIEAKELREEHRELKTSLSDADARVEKERQSHDKTKKMLSETEKDCEKVRTQAKDTAGRNLGMLMLGILIGSYFWSGRSAPKTEDKVQGKGKGCTKSDPKSPLRKSTTCPPWSPYPQPADSEPSPKSSVG